MLVMCNLKFLWSHLQLEEVYEFLFKELVVYTFVERMETMGSSELRYFSSSLTRICRGLCGVIPGEAASLLARVAGWREAKIDLYFPTLYL